MPPKVTKRRRVHPTATPQREKTDRNAAYTRRRRPEGKRRGTPRQLTATPPNVTGEGTPRTPDGDAPEKERRTPRTPDGDAQRKQEGGNAASRDGDAHTRGGEEGAAYTRRRHPNGANRGIPAYTRRRGPGREERTPRTPDGDAQERGKGPYTAYTRRRCKGSDAAYTRRRRHWTFHSTNKIRSCHEGQSRRESLKQNITPRRIDSENRSTMRRPSRKKPSKRQQNNTHGPHASTTAAAVDRYARRGGGGNQGGPQGAANAALGRDAKAKRPPRDGGPTPVDRVIDYRWAAPAKTGRRGPEKGGGGGGSTTTILFLK